MIWVFNFCCRNMTWHRHLHLLFDRDRRYLAWPTSERRRFINILFVPEVRWSHLSNITPVYMQQVVNSAAECKYFGGGSRNCVVVLHNERKGCRLALNNKHDPAFVSCKDNFWTKNNWRFIFPVGLFIDCQVADLRIHRIAAFLPTIFL